MENITPPSIRNLTALMYHLLGSKRFINLLMQLKKKNLTCLINLFFCNLNFRVCLHLEKAFEGQVPPRALFTL